MNPESRRLKKLLYLDTLIKINAFFREAAAEVLYGVYFTADFFGKENNPPINSTASFPARQDGESAGHRAQFETGLYYFGARYLDTRTSRWIGCDPLGPELANPGREGYSVLEGTNWYGYCSNNPINYSDPMGLMDESLGYHGKEYSEFKNKKDVEKNGAWDIENEWNDDYIRKYNDYVSRQIDAYEASSAEFTCEDLALNLLIDFASANNLPVQITNNSGLFGAKKTYDAASKRFNSVDEYKNAVMKTTGANDLMNNTIAISSGGVGDMILLDTGSPTGSHDGIMSHTQIITGFNFVSAQMFIAQGNTKDSGSDNPQSENYIGTTIQTATYGILSGNYQRESNPPVSNALTTFGAVYRQWNFLGMNQ